MLRYTSLNHPSKRYVIAERPFKARPKAIYITIIFLDLILPEATVGRIVTLVAIDQL